MTAYERGDVVLLPFPFTDQSGTKRRPAVILSMAEYNSRRFEVIVAPITGNVATGQPDDTRLLDWSAAGLLKPSVVKGILGTVDKRLIVRALGKLTPSDVRSIEGAFAEILGFGTPPVQAQD
jgi:mRNA interferase MazF